jgi:hypothetical protein
MKEGQGRCRSDEICIGATKAGFPPDKPVSQDKAMARRGLTDDTTFLGSVSFGSLCKGSVQQVFKHARQCQNSPWLLVNLLQAIKTFKSLHPIDIFVRANILR